MSIMASYSWKRIVAHLLGCLLVGTLSSRVLSTPHVSAGRINCDAKVAIAVFVHDQNMDSVLDSVKRFEDTFNHQCRHDLVFFSSSPLSEDNKQVAANRTRGTCIFETIPVSLWKVDRWSRLEAESTGVLSNNFVLLNNCSTAEADANLPCWSSVSMESLKRLQQYDWCWKIQVYVSGRFSLHLDQRISNTGHRMSVAQVVFISRRSKCPKLECQHGPMERLRGQVSSAAVSYLTIL